LELHHWRSLPWLAGSQFQTEQPFKENVFDVLSRIQHGQNVDGSLRDPADDSPWYNNQFTILSDPLILKLRDNAASAWKRMKVMDFFFDVAEYFERARRAVCSNIFNDASEVSF
jgi:hypothetical protein